MILAGQVFSGDRRLDKPGIAQPDDLPLEVRGASSPFVSRGGQKLDHALDHFGIEAAGMVAVDVGASTGGFTDVLLQRGARKVYAVDVGHGQLAWRLRTDSRIVVLERTNARHLSPELIPEPVDLVVCDASFISLKTVLPAPLALSRPRSYLIALIKPQFEVGKGAVGKGGVVRDPEQHNATCEMIQRWLEDEQSWRVLGVTPSPILGPKGNREFLIAARRPPRSEEP